MNRQYLLEDGVKELLENKIEEVKLIDLPQDIFINSMADAGVPENIITPMIVNLSMTSKNLNGLFELDVVDRARVKFCQAVIDDDHKTATNILALKPKILSEKISKKFFIQSQLTWQRFCMEDPLMMAVKRKQLKMIKFLVDNIDIDNTVNALSAWESYQIENSKIVISEVYGNYAKHLIDIISQENFPHLEFKQFNNETKFTLSLLRNFLFPNKAVKLDNYFNIELLLLAVYKTFLENFDNLTLQQQIICNIRLVGLIQSALSPETAKVLCSGFGSNLMQDQGLLLIKSVNDYFINPVNQSFYRNDCDSMIGLGYTFACDVEGCQSIMPSKNLIEQFVNNFEDYLQQKEKFFHNFLKTYRIDIDSGNKHNGCVII